MRASLVIPLVLWSAASAWLGGGGERAPAAVRYGRDVRPILADRCFVCHGFDDKKRQAGLRLDTFEAATAAREDGAAIVPGKPEESLLLARIHHADPDERMPPLDSRRKPLSEEEQDILARWIAAGAPYEPHWAFVPPAEQPVPTLAHPERARNEIDRFLQAVLEREELAPSPAASPATELRRLFLTLTGLPPTPEELAAYLAER
ncbi:MAG: c-type cytochrome domain-containing protein, partial [Planctomycetota bacterium]